MINDGFAARGFPSDLRGTRCLGYGTVLDAHSVSILRRVRFVTQRLWRSVVGMLP